jgi:hypothetical protein
MTSLQQERDELASQLEAAAADQADLDRRCSLPVCARTFLMGAPNGTDSNCARLHATAVGDQIARGSAAGGPPAGSPGAVPWAAIG